MEVDDTGESKLRGEKHRTARSVGVRWQLP